MSDALIAAVIGVGGALLGGVIGSVTTYFVQRKLINAQSVRLTHKDLLEKRLAALQELNLLLDFSYGNIGSTTGGPIGDLFVRIVKESPHKLAFLPSELREDGRKLMFKFFEAGRGKAIQVDAGEMDSLRKRVLAAIDETYRKYSSEGFAAR